MNAYSENNILDIFYNFQIKFNEIKMMRSNENLIFNVSSSYLGFELNEWIFVNGITSMKPLVEVLLLFEFPYKKPLASGTLRNNEEEKSTNDTQIISLSLFFVHHK